MKSRWSKPKLIILLRGRPEEAILAACKVAGNPSGAGGFNTNCKVPMGTQCGGNCNATTGS